MKSFIVAFAITMISPLQSAYAMGEPKVLSDIAIKLVDFDSFNLFKKEFPKCEIYSVTPFVLQHSEDKRTIKGWKPYVMVEGRMYYSVVHKDSEDCSKSTDS